MKTVESKTDTMEQIKFVIVPDVENIMMVTNMSIDRLAEDLGEKYMNTIAETKNSHKIDSFQLV